MKNVVNLIGRVGKDPEIRSMSNGSKCAKFSLATTEKWKDKRSGEMKEKTEWHNIVIWNEHLVSVVERFVSKGTLLDVIGALETRKWQDRDGADKYTTEIVLKFDGRILLLSPKNENGGGQQSGGGYASGTGSGGGGGNSGGGGGGSWNDRDGGSRERPPFDDDLDDQVPF